MVTDPYFYEPAEGHRLAHNPFNAIIAPRPIGWISSISREGILNLAPYSFFNAFNYTPPIIGFASIGYKDSVANIEATGEFVWNLASRELAEQMNASSAALGPDVDEFQRAGLSATPSRIVSVPRVGEARVSFECRLTQIVQLERADGERIPTWMTFGEVVGVHIDRDLIRDGIYDTAAARPILRAGGPTDYFEIDPADRFHMPRPSS